MALQLLKVFFTLLHLVAHHLRPFSQLVHFGYSLQERLKHGFHLQSVLFFFLRRHWNWRRLCLLLGLLLGLFGILLACSCRNHFHCFSKLLTSSVEMATCIKMSNAVASPPRTWVCS